MTEKTDYEQTLSFKKQCRTTGLLLFESVNSARFSLPDFYCRTCPAVTDYERLSMIR